MVMGAERQQIWQRINELAAAGDETAAYLAGVFTRPEQLLGGPDTGGGSKKPPPPGRRRRGRAAPPGRAGPPAAPEASPGATHLPRRVTTGARPSSARTRIAFRAVARATPYSSMTACTVGRRAPGGSSPDVIRARRNAAICRYGGSGPSRSIIVIGAAMDQ